MNFFANWRLAAKLMAGFAATAVITVGVGWMGVRYVTKESATIETLYKRHVEGVSNLKQAQVELLRALSFQKNALVAYTPEQRDKNLSDMRGAQSNFEDLLRRMADGQGGPGMETQARAGQEKDQLDRIRSGWTEFRQVNEQIAGKVLNGEAEQAFSLSNGASAQRFIATQKELEKAVADRREQSAAAYEDSAARNREARTWLLGLSLLGSVLGLGFGYWVSRLIVTPMNGLLEGFERLREGDLTAEIEVSGQDEVGQLSDAYNQVVAKLRSVVSDVQSASARVSQAVALVSASAGGRHGAATIESTAAAMQQISAAAEQNATVAAEAAREFESAQESSAEGKHAATRMSEAVNEINEGSRRISQIIHVMDEIAFQTNLLALNAAVEAAHAGDEGKGFAVVAAEVRALAQRSAEAAKDITGLIKTSVERAAAGKDLASKSGQSLEEIAQNVARVSAMMRRIADGSNEQKQAMRDAKEAITRIDHTMQENAQDVRHLTEVVSYFRIG
jgi:methyl-accepting chemotaxis protein